MGEEALLRYLYAGKTFHKICSFASFLNGLQWAKEMPMKDQLYICKKSNYGMDVFQPCTNNKVGQTPRDFILNDVTLIAICDIKQDPTEHSAKCVYHIWQEWNIVPNQPSPPPPRFTSSSPVSAFPPPSNAPNFTIVSSTRVPMEM